MNKKALALVGIVGVGGVVLYLVLKAKQPQPAALSLQIYDSEGNLLKGSSPVQLVEGAKYTVVLTVKNLSAKIVDSTRYAVGALLYIGLRAKTTQRILLGGPVTSVSFGPDETKSFSYNLTVPVGAGGETGEITGWVESPQQEEIAYITEPISIKAVAITYEVEVQLGPYTHQ